MVLLSTLHQVEKRLMLSESANAALQLMDGEVRLSAVVESMDEGACAKVLGTCGRVRELLCVLARQGGDSPMVEPLVERDLVAPTP